jgi:hypothetical protein
MSYTPDDQLLEPGIQNILDGIRQLQNSIRERLTYPNDWSSGHLSEIKEIRVELTKWENTLLDLKERVR